MFRRRILLTVVCVVAATGARTAADVNVRDTRLLHQPATSGVHIAFVYADDLWVARMDGSEVRRLTTDDGVESNPAFSPDGKLLAFTAQYEGNRDVYIVPVEGGVPNRLTWHPGADEVQGFTPDGRKVLFTSGRSVFTGRYTQLFTVPIEGGLEEALPIPNAASGAYSPDGRRIAYNPIGPPFEQWKNYRGGQVSRIWLYDTSSHDIEKVPQPTARANDVDGAWIGGTLYFRSDRNGEFNLFSYDPRTKAVAQLTGHDDFPVLNLAAGGGKIVYEQAGYLHALDPSTKTSQKITVGVPSDLRETRPRFVKGVNWIRSAAISPTGARAVFEFRGEIISVPAEKGDARNLTNTTGAHERSPAWSPDGSRVAYFSDASGEYELYVAAADGKGEPTKYRLGGAGFYSNLRWSPDSRKVAYTDNSQSLYVLDVGGAASAAKRVAAAKVYGPFNPITFGWSPDSRWLAYTVNTQPLAMRLSAYSIEQDKSFPISDGLAEVSDPVFDRNGKYLYLFGSTDAGPVLDWFAQSTAENRRTRNVYLIVLRNDLPSPLARESDEEKAKTESEPKPESKPPQAETTEKPADAVRIDFEGIEYRILDLPVPGGDLSSLQAGDAGHMYYLRETEAPPPPGPPGASPPRARLHHFDLNKRQDEQLLENVRDFRISADAKKLLYAGRDTWSIVSLSAKINPADGRLAVADLEVKIDPRVEWAQIFDEAWRINRDYFYAPNMHGIDWPAMRKKYAALLGDVAVRSDLNRVLQWMSSELSVGHHRVGGGDRLETPKTVPGGLLGADYTVENGRYRFKKVYGGLNWNPRLRAPLTEPGVNVRAGEYLIAVRGRDVRPTANIHSFFENTAGKIVDITVGPNLDGSGSRTVQVVPIDSESALRNRDWVEGNLRKVDQATGGRVAYVYVPNTAEPGYTYFKRYFYPQSYKDAVIVDERFNGGGQVADYYIDLLRRPFISYWATRYGEDLKTPTASIQGPKVMIIDETAGSGGDLLPWMFRKFGMGKLVGQRTWGGLVGTLGYPPLMDGGSITAPNLAIWTAEEGWVVENEGVPPDIEVEQTPKDVIAGRDPQLERAIAVAMEELTKNPPARPKRPAYPIKGKTQRGTITTSQR